MISIREDGGSITINSVKSHEWNGKGKRRKEAESS